jgi:hypothetical protein
MPYRFHIETYGAPAMIRRLVLPAAFAALAAPASANTNQYRAELGAPSPVQRFVVRDLVWSCAGDSCVARQTTSLPATDCSALAAKVGALRSFSVADRPLPADALEKCNARAR